MNVTTNSHLRGPAVLAVFSFVLSACGQSGSGPNPPVSQGAPTPQASVPPTPSPTPIPTPEPTPVPTPTPSGPTVVTDDASLWRTLTQDDPFGGYRLFPGVAEIESGRLDGSEAHPRVRVTLNATAFRVLENGKLPAGRRFPNGAIIFKEVIGQGIYAVMRKEEGGPISGSGWAWAEFRTNGSVVYSTAARGGACISCHSRQRGPQNDLVRTFERQ